MKLTIIQSIPVSEDFPLEEALSYWNRAKSIKDLEVEIVCPKGHLNKEAYSEIMKDSDYVIGAWISSSWLTEDFLKDHPKLKYVGCLGHGYDSKCVPLMQGRDLTLCNTIYGDVTIAQYAMALLLDICHGIAVQTDYVKNEYLKDRTQNYEKTIVPQIELYNKTMGIIGLGAIGLWTAKMAAGFGMKVISYSRHKKIGSQYDFVEQVSMDELLERSDVISVHCPYTPENDKMIGKEAISKMKDGVILINTARGKLIDEDALYEALESRKIYAAGLDVLAEEPPTKKTPIMSSEHTKVTGHIAWLPKDARIRNINMSIDNFISYLEGKPVSVIK